MHHFYLDFIARPLYMFRVLSAPIIRSTINCNLLPLVQCVHDRAPPDHGHILTDFTYYTHDVSEHMLYQWQ
jgi:hypothetical protein